MNRKWSSLLLLLVLTITDAYLLAHPNLIGRIGVFIYKHSYIRNFPKALLTVTLTVGVALAISELASRFLTRKWGLMVLLFLEIVAIAWFVYMYITFSSFSYRLTGKAFIYGAHLLPVIITGIFSRYLLKQILAPTLVETRLKVENGRSDEGI